MMAEPISAFKRFENNRCPSLVRGSCVHGFPMERYCVGFLNAERMPLPMCMDEERAGEAYFDIGGRPLTKLEQSHDD